MSMEIDKHHIKTLYETRFLKCYDLQYAEGKHYYESSRREKKDLVAGMADDAVRGMLPDAVGLATGEVIRRFPGDVRFGIHCHNDIGMAEADSLEAVLSGAVMVQGSVSGMGERCGNANLNTLIPLLQLKLGFTCIAPEQLEKLTPTVRRINELANRAFDENEPFVGSHAFTHKAGMHIDGVNKNPRSFEHIDPALVGNERNYLASRLSGRAAALKFLHTAIPELTDLDKNSDKVIGALELLRQKENEGYNYEGASASLWLLLRNHFGLGRRSFELIHYQVNINESSSESLCTAIVKIRVGEISTLTAAEGNGPVNALDIALRRALTGFYPQAGAIRLTDYRVRVLASAKATASTVRVVIETTDGIRTWRTTGASFDIIDASWQALADSYEYAFQTSRKDTD